MEAPLEGTRVVQCPCGVAFAVEADPNPTPPSGEPREGAGGGGPPPVALYAVGGLALVALLAVAALAWTGDVGLIGTVDDEGTLTGGEPNWNGLDFVVDTEETGDAIAFTYGYRAVDEQGRPLEPEQTQAAPRLYYLVQDQQLEGNGSGEDWNTCEEQICEFDALGDGHVYLSMYEPRLGPHSAWIDLGEGLHYQHSSLGWFTPSEWNGSLNWFMGRMQEIDSADAAEVSVELEEIHIMAEDCSYDIRTTGGGSKKGTEERGCVRVEMNVSHLGGERSIDPVFPWHLERDDNETESLMGDVHGPDRIEPGESATVFIDQVLHWDERDLTFVYQPIGTSGDAEYAISLPEDWADDRPEEVKGEEEA